MNERVSAREVSRPYEEPTSDRPPIGLLVVVGGTIAVTLLIFLGYGIGAIV